MTPHGDIPAPPRCRGNRASAVCAVALALAAASCGDRKATVLVETSAVRACIRSTACEVKSYPRISHCLDDLRVEASRAVSAVLASIYHCVNGATSCGEVEACYGLLGTCGQDFVARCDGGTAVACDLIEKRAYRYQCGAVGAGCQVDPTHAFDATCIGEPSSAEFEARMDADCSDGVCSVGDPCNADALNRCQGAALEACIDGRWLRFDCAGLGLGPCQTMENGWGRCSPRWGT